MRPHALIEALLVKRMQETGRPGGRQGGALKDLLQLAVVLGVQTPDARGSLAADDLAADDLVLPGVARDQTQAGIRPQLPFGAKAKRGAQESQQESGPHRPDARHGAEEGVSRITSGFGPQRLASPFPQLL